MMLVVLALLFAGLCCFTFWIRTGVFWPWYNDGYWDLMGRSFQPTGRDQVTLNDFLTAPISVKDVPIHGVITGLLFASLCSIPLLVAILYRFPFAVVFAVMVSFLATMPWLGITVLGGCALASLPPLRFSFRYASALLGLIPIGIYFVSASWEPGGSETQLLQHRALLYGPWVLALLGSCVICAVALGITRLIGYRPGGIPPVLAMLFAIPVFLFYKYVGRDELEYRILEQQVGPGSEAMFQTVNVGESAARTAPRLWGETAQESYDAIYHRLADAFTKEALLKAEQDRENAAAICDAFIRRFPKSRHVPAVLYLKGRAQDQHLQSAKLLADRIAEFRSDVPCRASRRTWETLVKEFPSNRQSAAAMYKLAVFDGRAGELDAAIDRLARLLEQFDPVQVTTQPGAVALDSSRSSLARSAPRMASSSELLPILFQARRLREMLTACREDVPRDYADVFVSPASHAEEAVRPVQALLWFDDTDTKYRYNLDALIRCFPESEAARYAAVRLALLEPAVSRRIARFKAVAEANAGRPAGAEALFYLGIARQEDSILDEAKTAFEELMKEYPESCWATEAKARLSSLAMLEAGTAEPMGG